MATKSIASAVLASLAFAILVATPGCGKKEKPVDYTPAAEKRMNDPEYVKKLDGIKAERSKIVKELQEARIKVKVALADDPEGKSEKVKALKEQELACVRRLEKNRVDAMAVIRDRMLEDTDLNKTKKETK
jgi:hypothetical protein